MNPNTSLLPRERLLAALVAVWLFSEALLAAKVSVSWGILYIPLRVFFLPVPASLVAVAAALDLVRRRATATRCAFTILASAIVVYFQWFYPYALPTFFGIVPS